jgi:hypothetical protein
LEEELTSVSAGVEGSEEECAVKAMLDARDEAHAEQLKMVSEELKTEVQCANAPALNDGL